MANPSSLRVTFQPFQNLYQHVKKGDPRLFDALNRIEVNLQSLTGGVNESATAAPAGGAVEPPLPMPSGLSFTPAQYEYGVFTIENIGIIDPEKLLGIIWIVYFVDEITADCFVTLDTGIDNISDPITLAVTPNPDQISSLTFETNDLVIFNDNGSYEIATLTDASTFTIARNSVHMDALFGSTMSPHSAGVTIFKIQSRSFGSIGNVNAGIPDREDFPMPSVAVCCVHGIVFNKDAAADASVLNTALPDLPGIRTLNGQNYEFDIPSSLAASAGTRIAMTKLVQFVGSVRVYFITVKTAPTGASLIVHIQYSRDGGTTWTNIQTLTIPAGDFNSYTGLSPNPGDARIPYGTDWPAQIFLEEDMLDLSIEQVGSTVPGADLTLEIYT